MRCENYSKITIIVLWGYLFKVTKNVINHQLNTYIESKGMDPHKMSKEEKDEHKGAMLQEMYEGRKNKRRILYRTVGENEAETFSSYSHSIMIRLFLLISLIIQKQEESP